MPTHPSSPAHPKKPARKRTVGDFILAAIGYAIILPMFGFCLIAFPIGVYSAFVSLRDDIWLHSHGALAHNPDAYYIHHRTKYSEEEFCISYETAEGQEHHKCTSILMPFVRPDTKQPLIVHYDPASPDHASTSWGRQFLISRTLFFLFCFFAVLGIEIGALAAVIKKLTGWEMLAASTNPQESSYPAAPSKPSNPPGPGLRAAALELSATLDKILSGLQSQTGANAPYAGAIVAELSPLIAQYNQAVLVARSRDEADRALTEVVACMNDFKAGKKKRGMHFGFRHMLEMRKYESLTDIFRETRYRNDSL
jgi:hypothetical protein